MNESFPKTYAGVVFALLAVQASLFVYVALHVAGTVIG